MMKIRYHKKGTSVWYTTPEFNPDGLPLNKFRLGIVKGSVKVGNELRMELEKPNFPDIPFTQGLPQVTLPYGHYDFEDVWELQPEGFYIIKKVYTFIWDVTEEEYREALAAWEMHFRNYLVTAQEYYLPDIPDTPDYEWQLVDMTKPYRYRFTPIPVEHGRFSGNIWKQSEMDIVSHYSEFATSSDAMNMIVRKTITIP